MFLNPLMLAGLGGALLPLVLHLLSRSRYRSVDWGAMMFLDAADPRDRQSTRIKQYVLLALRMLIVALLAVTLARPVASRTWATTLAPSGPTTAVFILDCSASMSVVEGGRSRMDAARDVASRLLAVMKNGDRVSLITAGLPQEDGDLAPSSDLRTIAARVAATRAGVGRADMAQALDRAAQLIKRYGQGQDARIFVVADRQASSWSDVDASFATTFRTGWGSPDVSGRLTIFPVGGDLSDNVLVESVHIVDPPAIKGELVDIDVRVRATGKSAQPSIPVTLARDGRPISTQTLSLAAGDAATARFIARFEQLRSYVLTASTSGVGMPTDDVRQTAVDVGEPIRVLLVSGDEPDAVSPASNALAESTFFRAAVAPYTAAGVKRGVDPATVTVVRAEALDSATIARQQVVVLANVPQLSSEGLKAIEQFVYEGGGLLVAPGGLVDVNAYNSTMWRDGGGFLPAQLFPATPAGSAGPTTLLGIDLTYPAFAFLKGRPDPIPNATIGRYFPVTPRQPDAVVPATYTSGHPFLVEAGWGRGRVALLTTPLDTDWSTLPLSGFYVPFVQSLVRHLSGSADRDLAPGQPIITMIDNAIAGEPIVAMPDGRRQTPAVSRAGGRTEIRFDDTITPGLYTLRYRVGKDDQRIHFVVQSPTDESDISPMTTAQWDELAATLGAARLEPTDDAIASVFTGARHGRELWAPLLTLVAVLLTVEMLLGRRWSAGVSA